MVARQKILIVDDDTNIAELISLYLTKECFDTKTVNDGEEALAAFEQYMPNLILLDLMLPGIDGYQVCREIRAKSDTPIIMLSAKSEDTDKIAGLGFGADDYVTKPFRPLELVARVNAQLRRYKRYNPAQASSQEQASDLLLHSGLEMNTGTHACFLNGKPLSLTPTEFSILRILLERKGKVVSSEELFHEIWKDEYYSKSNDDTITVHIRHLREKLGDTIDSPKYITTIWGVGYKIET